MRDTMPIVNTWTEKRSGPGWATVYIAGNINIVEEACTSYCFYNGLCVTVTPTKYIYTGGEEIGAAIGLINYPRFPKTMDQLVATAVSVGIACAEAAKQLSFSVVSPLGVVWYSRRPEDRQ